MSKFCDFVRLILKILWQFQFLKCMEWDEPGKRYVIIFLAINKLSCIQNVPLAWGSSHNEPEVTWTESSCSGEAVALATSEDGVLHPCCQVGQVSRAESAEVVPGMPSTGGPLSLPRGILGPVTRTRTGFIRSGCSALLLSQHLSVANLEEWIRSVPNGLLNVKSQHDNYSISQEICTRFLLCCALLWLYID